MDLQAGKFCSDLVFFSVLLVALLISVWARAEQVTLAWDANTEPDLAGYKVHYGTVSGSYATSVDVHKVTTAIVTGLTAGQTYYFAATPYNAANNESGYSNQVSYTVPVPNGAPATPATPSGASGALVNASIAFSTSATDPNGDSLEYRYDWGGGVLFQLGRGQPVSQLAGGWPIHRESPGAGHLLESAWSAGKTVSISQNQAPTANAGQDQTVAAGAAVSLNGTGSDPGQRDFKLAVAADRRHCGDPHRCSHPTSALHGPRTSPRGSATLVFEVRATDAGGLSVTDTVTVTVRSADLDGDGVPNNLDAFPNDPTEWQDYNKNGIGDNADCDVTARQASAGCTVLVSPVNRETVSRMPEPSDRSLPRPGCRQHPCQDPLAGVRRG